MRIKTNNRTLFRMFSRVPFVTVERPTSILPYVLGGLGLAIAGGIATMFFYSPSTRHRALGAAKDAYGRVRETIGLAEDEEMAHASAPLSNGLVGEHGSKSYQSTF